MPTATAARRRSSRAAPRPARRRRITPEDLHRFALPADPRISPGGDAVVFVHKQVGEKNEYRSNLWMVGTDGSPPRQYTGGGRDSHPRWSPDGTRIAFIGARDKHRPQVFTIPADGGEATALTRFPEGTIGDFTWSPDGARLAVRFREQDPQWTEAAKKERSEQGLSDPPRVIDHWWYRLDGDGYFNGQRHHLHLVDVATGDHRAVYTRDTMGFFSYDFSPDSRQLVVSTNRDPRAALKPWNDELLRINVATGRVTPIRGLPAGPKDAVAWSPNGRWIAYAGRVGVDSPYGTENLELWICDPAGGRARSLTDREDYCLMAVPITDTAEVRFGPTIRWAPNSRRIYFQLGWHGEVHLASVRPGGGRIEVHTRGRRMHFPGNFSADGSRMSMTSGTATKLDEVHVADLSAPEAAVTALTNLNGPLLRELDLSTPTSHWVTSADGTKVQTWVMRPPGSSPRARRPAVLEIHGGPHAQYGVGFFHEFQVLAAAGYVVVYSNPRGSKGYGRDHCAAIRGRWGEADWADIQAVMEFMKSRREVDAKRMGVTGGSYGGYMTNWAIGHTNDFKAAITDRCVSNLVSMFGSSDFPDVPDLYWEGNAWDRPEARWDQSPLKYLGRARTPTLIIHSEGDLRCNVEQAEQVHTALTVRRVPTRLVRYPASTGHGFSRMGPPDLRVHRLKQILDWWEKYLK